MSESKYQAKIIKQMEKDGWYVIKLIVTNKNGIPDLVCFRNKDKLEVIFIEVKGEKTKVSKLQEYRIKELKQHGFSAEIWREGE